MIEGGSSAASQHLRWPEITLREVARACSGPKAS
jgi:hypothetical protein